MDPADISSLNELLDRIAALGVTTDYDRIGLKPNQREIKSPPVTHLVVVVEERADNTSSPKLKTRYVRVSKPLKPGTLPLDGTSRPPNSKSDIESREHLDLPGPESVTSEILQALNIDVGRDSNFSPPTHHNQYSPSNSGPPDIYDLMYVRQQPQETVHHFWARFLLVKNKIKDCCDDDVISVFHRNCTDEGIQNALDNRHI